MKRDETYIKCTKITGEQGRMTAKTRVEIVSNKRKIWPTDFRNWQAQYPPLRYPVQCQERETKT
ncbi:MAG: hypothetical protein ACI4OJ_12415 [Lachnospiraceae bacterium]